MYANDNTSGGIFALTDYSAVLGQVKSTDPWNGATIGIQLFSDSNNGGYFDVDNVRLTSTTPEPTSLSLLAIGAAGLMARRRKTIARQK